MQLVAMLAVVQSMAIAMVQSSAATSPALIGGSVITLRGGRFSKFCSDGAAQGVSCAADSAKAAQQFTVVELSKDSWNKAGRLVRGLVALKGGKDGRFCADEGDKIVCSRATYTGSRAQFEVLDHGGKIAMKGGRYKKWCADDGKTIKCDRNEYDKTASSWELFTVKCVSGACLNPPPPSPVCRDYSQHVVRSAAGRNTTVRAISAYCKTNVDWVRTTGYQLYMNGPDGYLAKGMPANPTNCQIQQFIHKNDVDSSGSPKCPPVCTQCGTSKQRAPALAPKAAKAPAPKAAPAPATAPTSLPLRLKSRGDASVRLRLNECSREYKAALLICKVEQNRHLRRAGKSVCAAQPKRQVTTENCGCKSLWSVDGVDQCGCQATHLVGGLPWCVVRKASQCRQRMAAPGANVKDAKITGSKVTPDGSRRMWDTCHLPSNKLPNFGEMCARPLCSDRLLRLYANCRQLSPGVQWPLPKAGDMDTAENYNLQNQGLDTPASVEQLIRALKKDLPKCQAGAGDWGETPQAPLLPVGTPVIQLVIKVQLDKNAAFSNSSPQMLAKLISQLVDVDPKYITGATVATGGAGKPKTLEFKLFVPDTTKEQWTMNSTLALQQSMRPIGQTSIDALTLVSDRNRYTRKALGSSGLSHRFVVSLMSVVVGILMVAALLVMGISGAVWAGKHQLYGSPDGRVQPAKGRTSPPAGLRPKSKTREVRSGYGSPEHVMSSMELAEHALDLDSDSDQSEQARKRIRTVDAEMGPASPQQRQNTFGADGRTNSDRSLPSDYCESNASASDAASETDSTQPSVSDPGDFFSEPPGGQSEEDKEAKRQEAKRQEAKTMYLLNGSQAPLPETADGWPSTGIYLETDEAASTDLKQQKYSALYAGVSPRGPSRTGSHAKDAATRHAQPEQQPAKQPRGAMAAPPRRVPALSWKALVTRGSPFMVGNVAPAPQTTVQAAAAPAQKLSLALGGFSLNRAQEVAAAVSHVASFPQGRAVAPAPLRTEDSTPLPPAPREASSGASSDGSRSGGESAVYECQHQGCKYTSTYRGHLVRHERTHSGERPFPCTWPGCDYAARQTAHLTAHMRKHTKERNWKCDAPGCSFAAPSRWHLKRHAQGHEKGGRPGKSPTQHVPAAAPPPPASAEVFPACEPCEMPPLPPQPEPFAQVPHTDATIRVE